jgi:SAM-dependent methyltransferase
VSQEQNDRDRWDRRYEEDPTIGAPSGWLLTLGSLLPTSGRALDVAGGTGRNSLWLAERGFSVSLVDISAVGLQAAMAAASRRAFDLEIVEGNLEIEPLPAGPWDLVLCFHYLQRSLFEAYPNLLRPAGLLICELATVRNLERNPHPVRQFLLDDGELARLAKGLDVVSYTEGWTETDQHLARMVARRSGGVDLGDAGDPLL